MSSSIANQPRPTANQPVAEKPVGLLVYTRNPNAFKILGRDYFS